MKKVVHLLLITSFVLLFFLISFSEAQAAVSKIDILSPLQIDPVSVESNANVTISYEVSSDQNQGYQCYIDLIDYFGQASYSQVCDSSVFPVGTFEYSTVLNINPAWVEGLYGVKVRVINNVSTTEPESLGIDNTAPSIPTVSQPSDSGIYIKSGNLSTTNISWLQSTDNVLLKKDPITISYSLLGDFSDAVIIGYYDSTPTTITWTPPDVTNTTTRVKVTSTDLANHSSSDISNFAFTLDNQAPIIDAGSFSGDVTVPTAPGATASDNISSSANLSYNWEAISYPPGAVVTFSPNRATLDPTISADISGEYRLQLYVTDQAGNVSTDTVAFTWDGDPEVPTVITPSAPGITLQGGETYDITWTPPNDTDLLANPINIYYSATGNHKADSVLVVGYTANDGSYTWTVPNDNTDKALIMVEAEDVDGNTSFDESNNNFVIGDPYPPVVNVTPIAIASVTSNTSPTITGSVVDASNDVTSIERKVDTGIWEACTIIGSGLSVTFSCTTPTLSEGSHTVYVRATDSIGNVSSNTANFTTFTVDTTDPVVSLTTPDSAGILLRGGESYNITWSATDANLSGNSILLQYSSNNGSSWSTITTTNNDGTHPWTVPSINTSQALVRITATDDAGNDALDTSSNNFIIDSTPPAITVTNSALGVINSATAAGVSATDANGVASYSWAKISGSGTVTFSPNNTTANPTFSASTDDSYVVRVTVTDTVGNTNTADVSFTWDTTDPVVKVLTPNASGIVLNNSSSYEITWTVTEANISGNSILIEYSGNSGSTWSEIITTTNSGSYNWTTPANNQNEALIRITATDKAGNVGNDQSDNIFQIDANPPGVAVDPILGTINYNAPIVTGSALDLVTVVSVEYKVDDGSWLTCSADDGAFDEGTEDFSCTPSPALSDGSHTIYVRATDAFGHTSDGTQSTGSFTVDTTLPTVTSATASPNPAKAGTVTITVVFDKTMNTAVSPTVSITGLTGSYTATQSSYTGSTWAGTFTLADNNEDTTATISVSGAEDSVGNTMAPDTTAGTFAVDTISPSVLLTSASPANVNTDFTVTAVFSEAVTDFTVGDIVIMNGAASDFTGTGDTYNFTVTPAANGVVTVSVPSNVAVDVADNFNTAATPLARNYNTDKPTVLISSVTPDPINGIITVDVVFSADVTGFDISDISITNGVAQNFSGSGDNYAFEIDPTDGESISVSIQIPADVAIDDFNNTNTASNTLNYVADTVEPLISIIAADLGIISTSTVPNITVTDANGIATYTWSQVTGAGNILFSPNNDILASALSADQDGPFQALLTATDTAGNESTQTVDFIWDTTAPVITTNTINPNPTGDTTPSLDGNAVDLFSPISAVEYSLNGVDNWTACIAMDGTFDSLDEDYVCTISPALEAGSHTIYLRATDAENNVSDGSLTNSFDIDGSLTSVPTLIYPIAGISIQPQEVLINWEIPSINNLNSFQVEYSDDNGSTWTVLASSLASTTTSTSWTIADNTNVEENIIKVIAYDAFGDSVAAESGVFIIDDTVPVINMNSSLGTISTPTAPTTSVTDNFDDETELVYSWSSLSVPVGGTLGFASTTILNPTLSGNASGDYVAELMVADRAGNFATSSVAFTWYINPPSGGGGGGGSVNYCTQVEYSSWSVCNNGFQIRTVLSSSPSSCSLTTEQQLALTRVCQVDIVEPPIESPIDITPPSSDYLFDPEAVDVIEAARQNFTKIDENMVGNLLGKIVLQVEDKGRAWYINPKDGRKYYLGRPTNAFQVMRLIGFGISNANLDKIPVGIIDDSLKMDIDSDGDGLSNRLEEGLGSDFNKKDTDGDGFSDYEEVKNGYNILASGKTSVDANFTQKHSGKIFIQVERNGEAWYIEPNSQKRYYLGRPVEALAIMRTLSLGINNVDLNKIPVGSFEGLVD